MRITIASVFALFLTTVALPATAAWAERPGTSADYVVAEAPSIQMGGGANVIASQVLHQLCVQRPPFSDEFFVCLPSWSGISVADKGSTLWVDATSPTDSNDSEFHGLTSFEGFVDYITNGEPDWLVSGLSIGGGSGGAGEAEATLFAGAAGPSGVDLAGYAIDRIGFRVDAISIDSPGENPNGNGIWTDARLSGTYLFEGHIAGPSACARGGWEHLHAAGGSGFPDLPSCVRYAARGR
jgi:hypothetical protein